MKKPALLVAAIAVAGALFAATPASAQSFNSGFSFGFDVGGGYGYNHRWDGPRWNNNWSYRSHWDGPRYKSRWDGPRWSPRYRGGSRLSVDVGPIRFNINTRACTERYRSFNPRTGMYKTYGGVWKRCNL